MTLCDASPLIALIDADDVHHERCRAALPNLPGPLWTTWPCFTEAMHFLGKEQGWTGQEALWRFVDAGALRIYTSVEQDRPRMRELMEQYKDAPMDLADASLVAAAETLKLHRVFTVDRHFHAYRMNGRTAFEVVP